MYILYSYLFSQKNTMFFFLYGRRSFPTTRSAPTSQLIVLSSSYFSRSLPMLLFFWGVQQLPNCGTGCGLNPQPTSGGGSVKDDSGTLCTIASEEEGLSGRVVANLQSLLTARPHTADI